MSNVVSLCEYRKQRQLEDKLEMLDEVFTEGFRAGALEETCNCPYAMGDERREVWYKGFKAGRDSVYAREI